MLEDGTVGQEEKWLEPCGGMAKRSDLTYLSPSVTLQPLCDTFQAQSHLRICAGVIASTGNAWPPDLHVTGSHQCSPPLN